MIAFHSSYPTLTTPTVNFHLTFLKLSQNRLLSAPRAGLLRLLAKFKLDSVKEQFLETVECLWVVVNLDHHAGHLSLRVIAYLTRPLKRHRDSEHRSRVLLRRQAHHDKGLVAHGQRSSTRSLIFPGTR